MPERLFKNSSKDFMQNISSSINLDGGEVRKSNGHFNQPKVFPQNGSSPAPAWWSHCHFSHHHCEQTASFITAHITALTFTCHCRVSWTQTPAHSCPLLQYLKVNWTLEWDSGISAVRRLLWPQLSLAWSWRPLIILIKGPFPSVLKDVTNSKQWSLGWDDNFVNWRDQSEESNNYINYIDQVKSGVPGLTCSETLNRNTMRRMRTRFPDLWHFWLEHGIDAGHIITLSILTTG